MKNCKMKLLQETLMACSIQKNFQSLPPMNIFIFLKSSKEILNSVRNFSRARELFKHRYQ